MHYKNGRPAHNGDKIVFITNTSQGGRFARVFSGVLYDATAGNNTCNGSLAPFNGGNHVCPNLSECLHIDDFVAGLPSEWPDTTIQP